MKLRYLKKGECHNFTHHLQFENGLGNWEDVPVVDQRDVEEEERVNRISSDIALKHSVTPAKAAEIILAYRQHADF